VSLIPNLDRIRHLTECLQKCRSSRVGVSSL